MVYLQQTKEFVRASYNLAAVCSMNLQGISPVSRGSTFALFAQSLKQINVYMKSYHVRLWRAQGIVVSSSTTVATHTGVKGAYEALKINSLNNGKA